MRRLPQALVLTLLAVLPAACGFHLRGWDLAAAVDSVLVDANPRNPLELPLTRTLEQTGVNLVERPEEADAVVTLLDARQERRSISVTGQARAAEYELIQAVRFQISDGEGTVLVPARWLERQRVYRVDRDNIVGSSEEQALLEREMQADLVQQIIRAMNTAVTEPENAAESG